MKQLNIPTIIFIPAQMLIAYILIKPNSKKKKKQKKLHLTTLNTYITTTNYLKKLSMNPMKNIQKLKVKHGNILILILQSFILMVNMKPLSKNKFLLSFLMTLLPKLRSLHMPITQPKQILSEEVTIFINILKLIKKLLHKITILTNSTDSKLLTSLQLKSLIQTS